MDIYENLKKARKEYNECKDKIVIEMEREEEAEFEKKTKKRKKAMREIFHNYKK